MSETDAAAAAISAAETPGGTGLGGTTNISPSGESVTAAAGTTNVSSTAPADTGTPDSAFVEGVEGDPGEGGGAGATTGVGGVPGAGEVEGVRPGDPDVRPMDDGNPATAKSNALDAEDVIGDTGRRTTGVRATAYSQSSKAARAACAQRSTSLRRFSKKTAEATMAAPSSVR